MLTGTDGERVECCVEDCHKPAEDIDHRIPVQLGGVHDPSNWQPMCKVHHKIKTAQDVKDIARAKRRQKYHLEGRGRKRKGKKMESRSNWPKRKFGQRPAQTVKSTPSALQRLPRGET